MSSFCLMTLCCEMLQNLSFYLFLIWFLNNPDLCWHRIEHLLMQNEKFCLSFLIPKIWQILKRFASSFHQAWASYFLKSDLVSYSYMCSRNILIDYSIRFIYESNNFVCTYYAICITIYPYTCNFELNFLGKCTNSIHNSF